MRAPFLESVEGEEYLGTINVTSLVDVTLVILIIFILIAPIMEQGISLNLPKAASARIKSKNALKIEVNREGRIFLDGMAVSYPEFKERIDAIASYNPDQAILIRADKDNKYGDIVLIIDIIKQSGLSKVGILTLPRKE